METKTQGPDMPKAKLTDAVVAKASLPEDATEAVLWDTEVTGFGLRVTAGAKTYIVSYRPQVGGRAATKRRVKLGNPHTIKTAQEARRLALAVLGKVADGKDPAAERAREKRRGGAKVTDLLDRYEKDLERRAYVNRTTVMSGLRTRLAAFAQRDVSELTGADIAAIVERLEAQGKAGAAQDFRSRCRAFLSFCHAKAHAIPAHPMLGYRKERATRAEAVERVGRERELSAVDLAKVWNAADPATVFGRLIRFLILTGCRRGEAAGLRRDMIDAKAKVIRLPAVFTKQGRGHVVPIEPTLAALLKACTMDARSPELVFPSPRSGGVMKGWTKLVAGPCKASGVTFTLHDLRHTFRSGLSRLGIDPDTAELAQGHARQGLEAIYNHDDGLDRLRPAFAKWAKHVSSLVAAKSGATCQQAG